MLATLTDGPFDDPGWVFEDKYDGFRMVAKIKGGEVDLYSRNGKVISHSYIEFAKALEGVKGDAVIDGELVALDKDGVSHFQLLQNALRHEAKLLYRVFDLMFHDGQDLRGLTLLERKERLNGILPRHKLIAFSRHRKTFGTKFYKEAERKGLEGYGQAGQQHLRVRWPHGRLAQDQNCKTPGSCHCRIYCAQTVSPVFRCARSRRTRKERLVLHRTCRNRL